MKHLRELKGSELIAILENLGFEVVQVSEKHFHLHYVDDTKVLELIVPKYEYYVPKDVLSAVVKQIAHVLSDAELDSHFCHIPKAAFEVNHEFQNHVRLRPGMYIGATGSHGLHHLLALAIASTLDQAQAGTCDKLTVTVLPDERIIIEDNSKHLPYLLRNEQISPVTLIAFIDQKMNGIQMSKWGGFNFHLITALSRYSEVQIKIDRMVWRQRYEQGIPTEPISISTNAPDADTGIRIEIHPDMSIFDQGCSFNYANLVVWLRELAFLVPSLEIALIDERRQPFQHEVFSHPDGLAGFLRYVNRDRKAIHEVISGRINRDSEMRYSDQIRPVQIDFACQFTTDDTQLIISYANLDETLFGGSHVFSLESGVVSPFISLAHESGLLDRHTAEITGADFFPGFTGIISVQSPYLAYCGQLREKIADEAISRETYHAVFGVVEEFIRQNRDALQSVIRRTLERKHSKDLRRYGAVADELLTPTAKLR
jgi:DNA gyrase subunit B